MREEGGGGGLVPEGVSAERICIAFATQGGGFKGECWRGSKARDPSA